MIERRQKDTIAPQIAPDEVGTGNIASNATDSNDQEKQMQYVMRRIKAKTINNNRNSSNTGKLPTVLAEVGDDGFTKTVENLFNLSFLLRDGRAQLEVPHAINGPTDEVMTHHHLDAPKVCLRDRPTDNDWKTGEAKQSAFVMQFDMARYREWLGMDDTAEKTFDDNVLGSAKKSLYNRTNTHMTTSSDGGEKKKARRHL